MRAARESQIDIEGNGRVPETTRAINMSRLAANSLGGAAVQVGQVMAAAVLGRFVKAASAK